MKTQVLAEATNTAQLIEAANELAQRRSDCWTDDCYTFKNGYAIPRTQTPQWTAARKACNAIPPQVEYYGVICQSEVYFKGAKRFYRQKFYIRKEDGTRGVFSKAKAISKLG